jgi:enoyl-CoA hydratase/carnithine racemase
MAGEIQPPPINQVDLDTLGELQELASELESASELKVVVLESARPGFFPRALGHLQRSAIVGPGHGGALWIDISQRLAKVPVVSIAGHPRTGARCGE